MSETAPEASASESVNFQVDYKHVVASYQKQISALSNELALKDAAVDMLREEASSLKKQIDAISKQVADSQPSSKPALTGRTNGRKK